MEPFHDESGVPSLGLLSRRVFGLILFIIGGGQTLLFAGVGSWRPDIVLTEFYMNMQPYLFCGGLVLTFAGLYLLLRG